MTSWSTGEVTFTIRSSWTWSSRLQPTGRDQQHQPAVTDAGVELRAEGANVDSRHVRCCLGLGGPRPARNRDQQEHGHQSGQALRRLGAGRHHAGSTPRVRGWADVCL